MSVCELISHPRSATLELEFPLEPEEISTIKTESMKVHVVYIDSGINNDNGDAFALQSKQDFDEEEMESADEDDTAKPEEETTNGSKFSSEPGYELLAGKGKNKYTVRIQNLNTSRLLMVEKKGSYGMVWILNGRKSRQNCQIWTGQPFKI